MSPSARREAERPFPRSRGLRAAALAGVWCLPGLVLVILTYGVGPAYGFAPPRSLRHELLFVQVPLWGGWAVATPLIFRLSARHHPRPGRWVRPIAVHLGAAGLMWVVHGLLIALVQWRAGLIGQETGFWKSYLALIPQFAVLEFVVYPAVAATGFGVHMMRVSRRSERRAARLESQLSQARLEALRTRLHPHFLFNALNTVAMQMRRGAHRKALRLLLGFSDLLREILDLRRSMVPLEEEVDLARRILAIERARFGDRLEVEIVEDTAAADALVPALLLQPLVENALRHGVDRHEGEIVVRLTTERRGARVLVRLENQGPPLPERWSADRDAGTGLEVTRARVREAYEHRASMEIRDVEGGVVVSVDLPYEAAPAALAVGVAG